MKKIDADTTLDLPKEEIQKWKEETKAKGKAGRPGGEVTRQEAGAKEATVKITSTDLQMFVLLLHHKFLSLELLTSRFATKQRTPHKKDVRHAIYYRLNRMVKEGYLHSIRKDGYQLFLLAEGGLQAIRDFNKSNLPVVNLSDLSYVRHDLAAANLRFYFEEQGATNWTTERQLHQLAADRPKIPDGAFRWNGRFVFLEVEFSQKSIERYEKIYAHYARKGGPDLVLYFFQNRSHLEYLIQLAKENPRFAFFPYANKLPRLADAGGFSRIQETTIGKKLGELA